jgi:DNA-binding XRE family transcriptional regulator
LDFIIFIGKKSSESWTLSFLMAEKDAESWTLSFLMAERFGK